MAKKKQASICPQCKSQNIDMWPVIRVSWAFHEHRFCLNCGWDDVQETRKMSREQYQFFWQRYRMAWGQHLRSRQMEKCYSAQQTFFNVHRVFVAPRWMEDHFHGAMQWLAWQKHFREVEWPNRSLVDFWEYRSSYPKTTMQEFVAMRKALPPPDPYEYEGDYQYDY